MSSINAGLSVLGLLLLGTTAIITLALLVDAWLGEVADEI